MRIERRLLGTLMVGALLGGAVLSACSSRPSHTSASKTTTTRVKNTTTTSTPTTSSTGATTTTSGAPQNLAATAALKAQLTAVYVAHNNLPADQVAGTAPGSVYYAYLPSTQTYWAIASFVPTSTSSQQTQVSMQDDGCCGIFTQTAGGSWTFVSGYLGSPCTGQIPAELMTLWNLTSPGDCTPVTTTTD